MTGRKEAHWKEIEPGIAELTLDGRTPSNAFTERMVADLELAFAEIAESPSLRAVIVRGGKDYFSSGASIELLREFAAGRVDPREIRLPTLFLACPVPVLACLEGNAVGGGLALALSSDFAFFSESRRYGFSFMNFGFTPGMGTTGLGEEFFGRSLAAELLFTGKTVKGAKLKSAPGVTRVLPDEEVFPAALDLARELAEKPSRSVRLLKETLSRPRRARFETAFQNEIRMHEITFRDPATAETLKEWALELERR